MHGKRYLPFAMLVAILAVLLGCASVSHAETEVRVATYNIKFLNANVGDDRLAKIQQVIQLLEADIIALQEIDDRAALQKVFGTADWHLIIDDDSGQTQDVALAVRKPWKVLDMPADLDADDEHFLFEGTENNSAFPNRRDLLTVKVQSPDGKVEFFVMVVHAKSRFGGRAVNDSRRVAHSKAIVDKIRNDFEEDKLILLGDFNDNPDDQSLAILETGDENAPGGHENLPGQFLRNVTESLLIEGHVSHGLKSDAVSGDDLETRDPNSRSRNNNARGTNDNTGDILFDQILIPAWMADCCVSDSVAVFDHAIAASGNNTNRASDHVPVFADFVFEWPEEVAQPTVEVAIVSLLPNPHGTDAGNEQITIRNGTAQAVSLTGWQVVDKANNKRALTGSIPAGATLTITLTGGAMLNNTGGDEVWLWNTTANTQVGPKVSYTGSQAKSGATILVGSG